MELLLVFSLVLALPVGGWYIPGVSPKTYVEREAVRIMANSMTSSTSIVPMGAYSIHTCAPSMERRKKERKAENLGEILWGDQIEPSLYEAAMHVNVSCKRLCDPLMYSKPLMAELEKRIRNNYRANLILDNLPATMMTEEKTLMAVGYPLGAVKDQNVIIFNHLHLTIAYHKPAKLPEGTEGWRIVGFFVTPYSVAHSDSTCQGETFNPSAHSQITTTASRVTWSYSVSWKEDPHTEWASRWDVILRSGEGEAKVHWFSIINSMLIALFLSGMVAMILLRSLHKDFNTYNDPDEASLQEEKGWKLVHGDVYRPPAFFGLLCALVGSGVQLLGMTGVVLVFALLGFLSPANRGGLLIAMLLLFVLLGGYAGYVAGKLYASFNEHSWAVILMTGTMYPGFILLIYLILNTIHASLHSTSAIPFTSVVTLFGLWMGISLPLVLVGASVGHRNPVTPPCSTNKTARPIPSKVWYLNPEVVIPIGGLLPFATVFIELHFILSSLWQGRVIYIFGFLALIFTITCITCAEVSVVIVYFLLCYEDYNWWWPSFLATASTGVHLFLYSAYYFANYLTVTTTLSTVLYFGYMLIISSIFGLASGAVGVLSSFIFVLTIYKYIKID